MPDSANAAPQMPYIDPNDPGSWADMQQKQMLAGILMQSMGRGTQTPQNWDAMRVVPRRSALSNIAPLVGALMAGKATQGALGAQQRYFGGIMNPPQSDNTAPPPGAAPPASASIPSGGQVSAGGSVQAPAPGGGASSGAGWLPPPNQQAVQSIQLPNMPSLAYQNYLGLADPTRGAMIREQQLKQAQLAYGPQIQRIHSVALSDNPLGEIQSDSNLHNEWAQGASARGLDGTIGGKDFTPDNVRQVMAERANLYRAGLGQAPVTPPEFYTARDVGGALVQSEGHNTKPMTVTEPKMPGYEVKEVQDLNDPNKTRQVYVQTGVPYYPGSAAPKAPSAGAAAPATPGAPGAPAPATRPRGGGGPAPGATAPGTETYAKPTPEMQTSAAGAQLMHDSMPILQQIERSHTLSPEVRTLVLNALKDAQGDGIVGSVSSLIREKVLTSAMSPEDRQYLSAVIPLLQGQAHLLRREGSTTPGQLSAAFESLVPRDAAGVADADRNRQSIYHSLLGGMGSMASSPAYKGPAADLAGLSHPDVTPAQYASLKAGDPFWWKGKQYPKGGNASTAAK